MKKLVVFVVFVSLIFAALSVSIAFAAQSPEVNDDDFIPEVIESYEVDSNHKEIREIPIEFIRIESVKNAAKLDTEEMELFIDGYEEARKYTFGDVEYFFWLDVDDSVKNDDSFIAKVKLYVPRCEENENTYVKINSIAVDDECFVMDKDELSIFMSDFGAVNIGNY